MNKGILPLFSSCSQKRGLTGGFNDPGSDDPYTVSMVPEVGIEPTRACGSRDFESRASTSFTTPAQKLL